MTVVTHTPYSLHLTLCNFSVSRHFDTIEVIEAESQALLNILKKHYFQDAFQKGQKRWERCIHSEEDYLRVMLASRSKVSVHIAASVPEIVDGSLYI
jgi:hypothetical protein